MQFIGQPRRFHRNLPLSTLAWSAAVLCTAANAQIQRPIQAVNASQQRVALYNPITVVNAPIRSTSWEEVAGAILTGATGSPSVVAFPRGTNTFAGPGRTAIPTTTATGRVINGITGNGITGPVVTPAFRYPLGMPKPIGEGLEIISTGLLQRTVAGRQYQAFADAAVKFTQGVAIRGSATYTADTTGTVAFVTPGRSGPARSAGALVLDPITFSAHNGDVLSTDLILGSGMSANPIPGDPQGEEGFLYEASTDLPGMHSMIGTGDDGDLLLYKLSITFDAEDNNPMIQFEEDTEDGHFDAPGTNTPMTVQQIDQEVAQDLSFNPSTGWTLSNTEDLFEFDSNPITGAPAGGENIDVEMDSGVFVADAPEPGGVALGLIGTAPLALWRLRVRRRQR